jgi:hypothetical protein
MQSELDGATAKPLLRGVSHEIAALAALVGWAAVAATAPSGAAPVLATRLLFSGAAQDGLDLGFGVAIARAGLDEEVGVGGRQGVAAGTSSPFSAVRGAAVGASGAPSGGVRSPLAFRTCPKAAAMPWRTSASSGGRKCGS